MYTYTRSEAAEILSISTRSLDRYVKAGKLKAKKKWKIVYIKTEDVDKMSGTHAAKPNVIVQDAPINAHTTTITSPQGQQDSNTLSHIYTDLRQELKQKDELIQTLSVRLGRAEEITKNSINLVEFKKSQFLLEESKWHLNKEVQELGRENQNLKANLKYEKTTNIVLIMFVIILLVVAGTIWFMQI